MKKGQVKAGDRVTVNDLPDATLYRVDRVSGFTAELSYQCGEAWRYGGAMDVSRLQSPTPEQLENSGEG